MTKLLKRIDWTAAPTETITAIGAEADKIKTPCGSGAMAWHRWNGPVNKVPVVLLHGGWGSWTHWIRTIPRLAAERTIYAADLPGMGDSADAPLPHVAEELAGIVAEGIDAILPNGAPYQAVCFSFGGILGALVAAQHGRRCRGLTLVGAAGFGGLHFVVTGIQIPDPALPDHEFDTIHRNNLKLLMFNDDASIDPLALYVHRMNIARGRVRTRRISLSSALIEALPIVEAPVSGIWGAEDSTGGGLSNIEQRREILRKHKTESLFDVIDGAGHWVMYEANDRFCDTLNTHLKAHEERY